MNKLEIVTKQLLHYEEVAKRAIDGTLSTNPRVYIQYNGEQIIGSPKPEFIYGTLGENEELISITREQMIEILLELLTSRIKRKHQTLNPIIAQFNIISKIENPFLEDVIETDLEHYNISQRVNECLTAFLPFCYDGWFQDLFVYINGIKNTVRRIGIDSRKNNGNKFDIGFSHTYNKALEQSDLIPYSVRYKIATHLYNRLKTMIEYETSNEY